MSRFLYTIGEWFILPVMLGLLLFVLVMFVWVVIKFR